MFRYLRLAVLAIAAFLPLAGSVSALTRIDVQPATVEKTPVPAWVVSAPVVAAPENRRAQAANGLLYQLSETQVMWRQDGYEYFTRIVYDVLDRSGLEEASRINHGFDPEDSTLSFHYIRVTRDGASVDRLPDTQITLLRQEDGLTSGIISGTLTALAELTDIRVGDRIDYAYSGVIRTPLWPGEFFDTITMGWSVPIGQSRYRLTWPKTKPLHVRQFAGAPAPTVHEDGDFSIYELTATDPTPQPAEDATPAWHIGWPAVSFSTMKDWQDVQRWAKPIYDLDHSLPTDFDAKVKAIKANWKQPEDRLTEALRLVQDNIRYVGIEIGSGSHVPRAPAEVVRLGYGDCKDKAVLLTSVLTKLGIKAWPALVDLDQGPGIPDLLPAPTSFDHAIVKAVIKDKVYWLDPTMTHQGGRAPNLSTPGYAWGLPIGGKDNGLEPIEVPAAAAPRMDVVDTFVITNDDNGFFTLESEAIYLGADADNWRASNAGLSLADLNRSYYNYYNSRYPGLSEVAPVELEDDLDANRLIVRAHYRYDKAAADAADMSTKMPIYTWAIANLFVNPSQIDRRTPIALPYQVNRRHRIVLTLPGRRPKGADVPLERSVSTATFWRGMKAEGDTLTIEARATSTARQLDAGEAASFSRFAKEVSDYVSMTFNSTKVSQSLAGAYKLDEAEFAPIEADIVAAATAMQADKNTEALTILGRLEAEHKAANRLRGLIQHLRGQTLAKLNRDGSATAALEEALSLYPDDADSRFRLLELYRNAKDTQKEADTLVDFARTMPDEVKGLRTQWVSDLSRILYEDKKTDAFGPVAIALADAGYEADNGWGVDWIYSRALTARVKDGTIADGATYLDHVNDPGLLLDLMVDRRYEALWPAVEKRAGSDLRHALDNHVELRRKQYEAKKDDAAVLSAYLYALRIAGRADEAVKLGAPYVADWATVEAVADDAFWAANGYAYALSDTGRHREGEAVLARIADLNIDDFPDTISMRINLALTRLNAGNFAGALALAEQLGSKYSSDYGNMFIQMVKVCSLQNLDRQADAEAELALMANKPDSNYGAYTDALICVGQDDKAEAVYLDRLKDEVHRGTMLRLFQKTKTDKNLPSFLRKMLKRQAKVLARPSLVKAAETYGRIMTLDVLETRLE